eukprot:1191704-Rhodomonas_salina.3
MLAMLAVEVDQAHKLRSNAVVSKNMYLVSVTVETSHLEMSALNEDTENIPLMSFTAETSHFEMSPVKEDEENIERMSVIALVSAASTAAQAPELPPTHEPINADSSDFVNDPAPAVAHNANAVTRTRRVE